MTNLTSPPGGLTPKKFKYYAAEASSWLWGTVMGAFNEKQSLSQIIVDAVIGMIPVVGDVTAVRDLIAVSNGLINDPAKREKTSEWVLLVIFLFALIPVLGGVIKGVGRLALHVTEAGAKNGREIAQVMSNIIYFLNRVGHMNAEAWLRGLNVIKYEGEILAKFRSFCDVFILTIAGFGLRFHAVLPSRLIAGMERLSQGFKLLKSLGERMIPQALKDLHSRLEYIQKYVHAGGVPPPSREAIRLAQTGQKTITYVEEARLIESGAAKKVIHAGEFPQNVASADPGSVLEIANVYRHEPGYPDLLKHKDPKKIYYPAIAAASGPIKNEKLSGITLFRSFGDGGIVHGVKVGETYPIGAFWGVGKAPKTADEWRGPSAVLDEWNLNGNIAILHIPHNAQVKACTSTVSEQFSKKVPGQYLKGGSKQAVVTQIGDVDIAALSEKLLQNGGGKVTLPNGVVLEVKVSGWNNVHGVIGYGQTAIPGAAVVERLGITEMQEKVARQGSMSATKSQRTE